MTIAEIAKLANTSKATVSLALNNKPGVSPKTRQFIMEIAAEAGYVPASKCVAKKNIRLIAVSSKDSNDIHNFGTSFFAELINNIQTHCAELGYNLIYMAVPHGEYLSAVNAQEPENTSCGSIIIGTFLGDEEIEQLSAINNLVIIDNPCNRSNINSITMNNYLGGYMAASHLINLGHRNIGYIQSISRVANLNQRFAGFSDAMSENGLSLPDSRIFRSNCYMQSNVSNLSSILSRNDTIPTAFFCENDYHAFCLLSALSKLGLKVPDDVSVVGFDNVPESQISSPFLTTINVDRKALGYIAVNRLHEIINKRSDSFDRKNIITVELVERDSTSPCKR